MNPQTNTPQDGGDELRQFLIDAIDGRRFYEDFPALLHRDVAWLVDNCLLKKLQAREREAEKRGFDKALDLLAEAQSRFSVDSVATMSFMKNEGHKYKHELDNPKPQAGDGEGAL